MASSLPPTAIPLVSGGGDGDYTQLPATVSNVEWREGYAIGAGINIVTGDLARSPFTAVGEQQPSPMVAYNDSYIISKTSVDSCKELFSAMAGCEDFNLAPLNFSVSLLGRAVESVRDSMSSLTCVVSWRNVATDSHYDHSGFVLSNDARMLAQTNPGAFRATYGDYYIASVKEESTFLAIVALKELRKSERQELALKLDGGLKGLKAGFAREADTWVSQTSAAVRIRTYMSGLPRAAHNDSQAPSLEPTTFAGVSELLQWFQGVAQGAPRFAHLRAYHSLPGVDTIPDRLGISLAAFWSIREIRQLLLGCTTLANSLPEPYSSTGNESLHDQFKKLELDVRNAQAELPTNAQKRQKLHERLKLVRAQLEEVHAVYAVFRTVLQHREDEPKPRQDAPRLKWSYGLTTNFEHPHVQVHAGPSVEIRPGRHWPLRNDNAHKKINVEKGSHIVGWEVVPAVGGKGSWRKMSASVILAREAIITCRSDLLESSIWTFKTYVVSGNKFFDNFYLHADKSSEVTS
ncbi:hypothetical protein EXIGLDRAFT_776472 [Exidia glandulosa HHB12029]|uniref:Uncharacterized protein n=1 Tax=Exidia glandulosa HHB12029 TaxID=1314781 RepID=A0A165DGH2_EXIGL|nr:hypothetical protein EXIGLDRAFT_776472 [Exidia glandulosa HHB12029]